jgi:SAM-dependent methyltransferase
MNDKTLPGTDQAITVNYRQSCRICKSDKVKCFLRFPDMPFTDDLVQTNKGKEFLAPIDVYWCSECKTAQTLHDVDTSRYYREYQYTVSASPFARRFMTMLAEQTFATFKLRKGDRVVEIGSGDGYQLACFGKLGAKVLGFEPSAALVEKSLAQKVPVIQCLFGAEHVGRIPADMVPAQVVLLTYTFDHLPDPVPFLEAVKKVLDPLRGVLLIEVHDLNKIIERRETCLIEHEHSIYLSALSMKRLLARVGLRLLTTQLLPVSDRRGNSLLVVACGQTAIHRPDKSVSCLDLIHLDRWSTYEQFEAEVSRSYARLRDHVRQQTNQGRRMAGFGAAGRGVLTLAQSGLGESDIAYVCDNNPALHGLLTPKSHIPVVPPAQLLTDPVDEVIVFSFGYFREIAQQSAEYLQGGGRLTSLLDLL